MNFKESCLLNQKNFDHVKNIEKEVYPPRMHTYQDFDDIKELLDYSGCNKKQIDCIIKNDWYAIFCNGPTEVEITDFASRKPLGFAEILEVKNKLQSFGDKIISMNARESTSYKIIKLGERRGWFKIISDEPNITFGEPMHEITMKVIPQTSFKEWLYIIEAIDANTKNLLAKQKAPKDQLNTFIKELEDEPTLIDNKTAFKRFQSEFNIQKKVTAEDAQRKHFATIPNTTEEELQTYDYYKTENKDSLKKMMEQLRKFIDKKLITLKIENKVPNLYRNNQKLDTPDFSRFTSQLDSIQAELTKYSGKGNKPNPLELALSHAEHRVVKGDNIWVFKGHRPNICRILGKNQRWCISSGTSAAHWFGYRIQHHQTQYFVFDFNKDENDPARYVNPGVAPEGMYSEWVDAENKHSLDPNGGEDSHSHVGINGYKSINEYKEYLVSKGIPLTTWTTTPPEDWEIRLHRYYQWNLEDDNSYKSFSSAKNDEHPELFDLYIKIANTMKDSDFETLTDDQKKEFLLGKAVYEITMTQFNYAIENFKGDYYNSLDLDGKIIFAGRTNDQEKLLKFTKDNSLVEDNIFSFFEFAKNPDELIISLVDNSYIFAGMPEYISGNTIQIFLQSAKNKEKIAIKLGTKLINQMEQGQIKSLMTNVIDKDEIANILVKYKTNLDGKEVAIIIKYAKSKNLIAHSLTSTNINKITAFDIERLLKFNTQVQIANIIVKYKTNLTSLEVKTILAETPTKNLYDIAEKLGEHNINKIKLEHMSEMFKTLTYDFIDEDDNRKITLSKVLNQYHTNKTPEIQELIDKYINYLKDRGTSY